MEIISWNFLYFSSISIIIYYFLSRRAQNIWLCGVSYFFYSTWSWTFPVTLAIVTIINYKIALRISKGFAERKKTWLLIGLTTNICALLIFRLIDNPEFFYTAFHLVGNNTNVLKDVILPIGFSFYCLQGISYLVDVAKFRYRAEEDFVDFALYMSFFPKLVAGPIERANSFLSQLKRRRIVDNEKIESGLSQILIGLFRKIVIAGLLLASLPNNLLALPVENTHPVFGLLSFPFFYFKDSAPYSFRLFGIIGYAIYLYNDFAGYSGIARGISDLLGIKITENFRQPFLAHSFIDFWNRWHISLSNWLRDYIYYPLTRSLLKTNKNAPNFLNLCIPPIITMLVSGFWHGLFPALILWGLLNGVILASEHIIFRKLLFLNPKNKSRYKNLLPSFAVFILTVLLFVPFATKSLPITFAFWKVLLKGSRQPLYGDLSYFLFTLPVTSFVLDYLQNQSKETVFFKYWPYFAKACIFIIVLMSIAIAAVWTLGSISKQFIYQGF